MRPGATQRMPVTRWQNSASSESFDQVSAEEPLEIRVAGRPVSVTMRTPGDDLELAAGFLFTEGLISSAPAPLLRSEHPNVVNAAVSADPRALERLNRRSFVASSCGLCGKATIEAVQQDFPPIEEEFRVPADLLPRLVAALAQAQPQFAETGGLHAAGLFDASGKVVVVREDVGRHNAVDKAIGFALLRGLLPLSSHILVVSGRTSFEIVQKALAARIPIVAAVSAPSSLAISFAEASGQTLVGFVRGDRFNVYAHAERIAPVPEPDSDARC